MRLLFDDILKTKNSILIGAHHQYVQAAHVLKMERRCAPIGTSSLSVSLQREIKRQSRVLLETGRVGSIEQPFRNAKTTI